MNILIPTTVTSKGQVTIPQHIRESIGLKAGDKVIFKQEKDKLLVEKATSIVNMLSGIFYDPTRKPLSNRELEQAIEDSVVEAAWKRNKPKYPKQK